MPHGKKNKNLLRMLEQIKVKFVTLARLGGYMAKLRLIFSC